MMKKFMMIGLVVFGGVQGIYGMGFKPLFEKRTVALANLANVTPSFLNVLHTKRMWRQDLAAQVTAIRQRNQAREVEHRNSQFFNINQQSPRSWVAKPQARSVKLRDKSDHAMHADVLAMYA